MEAYPLDANANPTGSVYSTTTLDDLGHFVLAIPKNEQRDGLQVVGEGFYYNEMTASMSLAPISLHAIAGVGTAGSPNANLNLVTHMSYRRVLRLLQHGTRLSIAVQQAESELRVALGIIHPKPNRAGSGLSMNILGGDTADNQYLFGLSCIVAQAAMQDAGTCLGCAIGPNNSTDASLQSLINAIAFDLEADGHVGPALIAKLVAAEKTLDPAVCKANLASWLTSHGASQPVPDLTTVIDTDKDGIANASDPDDDNDGAPDASDCAPLDPSLSVLLADGRCMPDDDDDDDDGAPDTVDCAPRDSSDYRTTECDHTYRRFDRSMTWHEARDFCRAAGGSLAIITSDAENAFVWNQLGTSAPNFCWLGATDESLPDAWAWVTDEPVTWGGWLPGEPSNCNGGEHYAQMWTPSYYQWNSLGTGVSPDGQHGGCGCGGCDGEFYLMSTICEWGTRLPDDDNDGVPNAFDCAPLDLTCSCAFQGEKLCGRNCVDSKNDPANCGACGVQCPAGSVCSSGACTCSAGGTPCGNGRLDTCPAADGTAITEQCDDGNAVSGDGCSSTCTLEPGWACPSPGLVCTSLCGNGQVDTYTAADGTTVAEQCDDGNAVSGDGCSSTCTLEPGWACGTPGQPCHQAYCGNGITETYLDKTGVRQAEQCDDGNSIDTDACRNNCAVARCGDGVIWSGAEACDDGNAVSGDGCSSTCTIEPGWACPTPGAACSSLCGNGRLDTYTAPGGTTITEQCDDGNTLDYRSGCDIACVDSCIVTVSDGCSSSCKVQPGWVCNTPGQSCCPNRCLRGDTQCSNGYVQDCVTQVNGCTDWSQPTQCPDNNTCIGSDCRAGVHEPGLIVDSDTSKTLDGNHVYDGDVIIQNSSIVTVPTGKLIIRAKRVVLDASSTIVVKPTGKDPRGRGRTGGYGTAGGQSGSAYGVNTCFNCSALLICSGCSASPYCRDLISGGSAFASGDEEIASGGSGQANNEYATFCGGQANGGGYVAIFAEVIAVEGTIGANGVDSGSGGLVYLYATGDLTFVGNISTRGGGGFVQWYPLGGGSLPTSCDVYGLGGEGVVKFFYGGQRTISTSGVQGGVIFSSAISVDGP